MNELSKELHEAGLGDGSFGFIDGTKVPILSGLTLSQLIEACGEKFFRLSHSDNNDGTTWDAEGWESGEIFTGKTPEEAVARLWLALNKP